MNTYLEILTNGLDKRTKLVLDKCINSARISISEAETLFNNTPLFILSALASRRKREVSGDSVFYIKNFHIEPTNICRFNCRFCSYHKKSGDSDAWDMRLAEICDTARDYAVGGVTEVHLVGGVPFEYNTQKYLDIIRCVKEAIPGVTIKAFSAIEHIAVADSEGIGYKDYIKMLKEAGMDTITGGGAEIFSHEVRRKICPDKPNADKWLNFHEEVHRQGIKTNATMLYGHIESLHDRLDHMEKIRLSQDKYNGYNAFIPLKYRSKNNSMSHLGECSITDDLRTLAISRLFLDNVPHIKAYWPMYGKSTTEMALLFGADDIDGTIDDTTKIYSMAGVDTTSMSEMELKNIIISAGFKAVERDTFYNPIQQSL